MNLIDGDMHILGIRPEHLFLDSNAALRGRVASVESTGADRFVRAITPRGEIVLRVPIEQPPPGAGEDVGIAYHQRRVRRYDRSTGALLT